MLLSEKQNSKICFRLNEFELVLDRNRKSIKVPSDVNVYSVEKYDEFKVRSSKSGTKALDF